KTPSQRSRFRNKCDRRRRRRVLLRRRPPWLVRVSRRWPTTSTIRRQSRSAPKICSRSSRYEGSHWQVDEQPSPDTVLPSSHCSPASTTPLPHSGGGGGVSIVQSAEQPSPSTVLPSSHCSPAS